MEIEELKERIKIKEGQFKALRQMPKPYEVNMKVGVANAKGFSLLIYLTSSFVSKRLNESGLSYSLDYQERDGSVLCKLSYFDIVSEQMMEIKDVGITTKNLGNNNQTIKSGFSDSTKRAFSRLAGNPFSGMPFIWISGGVKQNRNGKYEPDFSHAPTSLNITKMDFEGTQCSTLVIADRTGKVLFNYENHVLLSTVEDYEAVEVKEDDDYLETAQDLYFKAEQNDIDIDEALEQLKILYSKETDKDKRNKIGDIGKSIKGMK